MNPYVEAVKALNAGNHDIAEKGLLALLREDFDNPVLLFALGSTYVAKRENGLAYSLLRRALEHLDGADESYRRLGVIQPNATAEGKRAFVRIQKAECLSALALCNRYEERRDEARKTLERALALAPNHPDVNINMGCMYVNDGNPQAGIKWLERALQIEPTNGEARANLALLQLELGMWKEGFANYDEGSRRTKEMVRVYTYPDGSSLPLWEGESGKSVLVYGEQGIGDEILFASCIPDLKTTASQVVFDCHPRLVALFERSFGINCHGTRKEQLLNWVQNYKFDARIAVGSLPKHFRSQGQFPKTPYLKAGRNASLDAMPGFKIGISWAGGYKQTRAAVRSMALTEMVPLLGADATFVSLQYTDCIDEIEHIERRTGKKIQRFDFVTDKKSDYDLTAELVNSCDLIISVNTSLVHLSGALGKECWTLTPDRPAWRYTTFSGEEMPWYGSVRQFRQAKGEEWSAVIARVKTALEQRMAQRAVA